MAEKNIQSLYGIAAEFDTPEAVLAAATAVAKAGYRRTDAFSPFAVEGLSEALGFECTGIPMVVGLGGLLGAIGGFGMLWYANVLSYPWNIGGRPPNSWEAFIPITFELAVLCASLSAVAGMFVLNGLPMPYHPAFNIPNFSMASRDRFYVLIESSDEKFDLEKTRAFLQELKPLTVTEVHK